MIPTTSVPTQDKTQPGYSHSRGRSIARFFAFGNMSAIYLFVVIFVIFALTIPDRFLRPQMWVALFDNQAIGFLAAVATVIPMVAGQINLAIAGQIAFSAMFTAVLLGPLGLPVAVQFPLVILVGGAVGAITGLIITFVKIDSIIATLGVNSLLLATIQVISGGGLRVRYADKQPDYDLLSTSDFLGITLPVWIALVVALISWYVLEATPVGRRMYAVGFNPDGAKLAGINTKAIIIASLTAGGLIAGLAGALLQARYVDGDPTIGNSYLLPALTAVFLGSTQFRSGRFNVWGAVVALFVLAVGIKGLQLAGAEPWVDQYFYGGALLLAVGIAQFPNAGSGVRKLFGNAFGRGRGNAAEDAKTIQASLDK